MKKIFLLSAIIILSVQNFSIASEQSGDLSASEIRLCRKKGCFGQGVSRDATIESVGEEIFSIDENTKDKYVMIPVLRKDGGIEIEFTIIQWIGTEKEPDQYKLADARAFADGLRKIQKQRKKVNLVVRGSANQMTAEFPIIGFFTNDGEFYFQERVVAPLLTDL